jgi:hypothetical protein
MVASKYLYDDGEVDEVFNDEWASAGHIDVKEMNGLEIDFLCAIDWSIHVTPDEFETMTRSLETATALKRIKSTDTSASANAPFPSSYADLDVLSRAIGLNRFWKLFANCTLSVTAVCAAAYTVGVAAMLSTICLMDRTPLGPRAMNVSLSLLLRSKQLALESPLMVSSDAESASLEETESLTSAADMLAATSIVLSSLNRLNDTDVLRIDDDEYGNGSLFETSSSSSSSTSSTSASSSLLDSVGDILLRMRDKAPPDRDLNWHSTSVDLAHDRDLIKLWKVEREKAAAAVAGGGRQKKCPILAWGPLRGSLALVSGFA